MSISVATSTAALNSADSLASLQRFVADYVQGPDDPDILDAARREINFAIDRVNTKVWKELIGKQDISLVASTADYALNGNVHKPLHVEVFDSSSNPVHRLWYKEMKTFLEEHPKADTDGSPSIYTLFFDSRTLTLNLAPNSDFVASYPTIRLRYYKTIPRLTDASDTHGAPGKFNAFIGWEARAGIAAVRRLQGYVIAQRKADAIWKELLQDNYDSMTDWDG